MKRAAIVALAAAIGGCGLRTVDPCSGEKGTCVGVQLQGNVGALDTIVFRATGGGLNAERTTSFDGRSFVLPVAVALEFPGIASSGTTSVALTATGLTHGAVVATGATKINIPANQHVAVSLELTAGSVGVGTGDMGGADGGASCTQGTHDCAGMCVDNMSVMSCGTMCAPCPSSADTGHIATCDGTSCGLACPDGDHQCAAFCVSNLSIANCGPNSCTACPAAANGSATCDGTTCGVTCNSGYLLSGATCIACGAVGQPCCANSTCDAGVVCDASSVCQSHWTLVPAALSMSGFFVGIWGSSPSDWYAADIYGTVYHSTGGSSAFVATWTGVGGSGVNIRGIWGSGANDIYIAGLGSDGFVVRNTGGVGGMWSTVTSASGEPAAIWGVDASNVFVVGSGSGTFIEKSTGGGAAFTLQTAPATTGQLNAIGGANATDLWAVGNGELLHYYGGSWAAVTYPGAPLDLTALGGSAANDFYVGGSSPGSPSLAYLAHWDGSAWTQVALPQKVSSTLLGINAIWAASSTDVYLGCSGGIAHYDGMTWTIEPPPAGVKQGSIVSMFGTSANDIYAAGSQFILRRP